MSCTLCGIATYEIHRRHLAQGRPWHRVIGIGYILAPAWMYARYGIGIESVNEANMVRGAYGGLFVASALLFLLGGLHARLAQPVLIYLLTFMLGFAMGRLTSVVVDGVPSVFVVLLLGLEVLYSAVAAWALYTNRNMTVPSRSEGTNENGTF